MQNLPTSRHLGIRGTLLSHDSEGRPLLAVGEPEVTMHVANGQKIESGVDFLQVLRSVSFSS